METKLSKDDTKKLDSYITGLKYNRPGYFTGNNVCFKWQGYVIYMNKINGRWIKKIEKE